MRWKLFEGWRPEVTNRSSWVRWTGCATVAVGLLLGGCAGDTGRGASNAADSASERLGPVQVVAQMRRSVVTIEAGQNLGTGFFVSPRLIVTNLHVVAGHESIEITTADRHRIPVLGVAAFDSEHDLVLLDIGKQLGHPAVVGADQGHASRVVGGG